MDTNILQSIFVLIMRDDPTNLGSEDRTRLEMWANRESMLLGFTDWVDAYHNNCIKRGGVDE